MCGCAPHACLVPWQTEEEIGSPGTGVMMDGYKLPSGCREPNSDLPREQQVLLIMEPFLQSPLTLLKSTFYNCKNSVLFLDCSNYKVNLPSWGDGFSVT